MIELRFPLQSKQKLFKETIESKPITLYGGAKGGGKSKGLRMIMLLRRFQYPGSYGAIFRRTYPELEGNHIRPLLEEFPQLREYWSEGKKLLTLPNGSTLQFCHCNNEGDIDLYQGREFHDLAIDEAGQWSEAMFRKLMGSNRSSKPGISAKAILTGNPGGIGHKWLKRLFIERRFTSLERGDDYAFIQALVDDNPALIHNDPDYVHRLEAEPNEALRKAYRYGDWDIFAGQFFGEITRDVHFINPFPIPHRWNRFGSYDFGYNHPAAFGWFASDEDGNVFLYRELVEAKLRVDQFAAKVNSFEDTKQLYPIAAGWDCWTQKGVLRTDSNPPTVAEEFQKHDLILKKAVIDRIQGAAQVRNYLAWRDLADGRDKPRFFIFNTCPISFDTLTRVQHDPNRVEDVLKIDASDGDPMSGDDAYDMIRMGLMTRPPLTDRLKVTHPYGSPAWSAQQVTEMEEKAEEHFGNQEKAEEGYGWSY
jgi:phage terminase large subunit